MALHGAAAAGIDETYNRRGPNIWSTDFYTRMIGRNAFGKSVALVVGVGNYDRFPKLSAPASDAMRVRDFLRDEAGFDQIITLTDEKATYSRIAELMETVIPDAVGQNDRFLFYFSGHGVTRNLALTKRGYLVLKNSARGSWQDMIDMERMKQWTENVAQARHSLFLLDACFSGLAAFEVKAGDVREKTIARLMQPGHHIVTAGTEGEETFIYKEQSLFTQAFLSAARGDGMSPQDGIVSLNEMMSRVNRILDAKQAEVGDKIRMTPRHYHARISNNAGEFFFLPERRPASVVATVPPSPSIQEAPIPKGAGSDTIAAIEADPQINRPSPGQPVPPISSNSFTIRKGTEATGTLLRDAFYGGSVGECEQHCTRRPACNVYTFSHRSQGCFLYSSINLVPNSNFESGIRTSAAPPASQPAPSASILKFAIRRGMEAKGTLLRDAFYGASIGECEQQCARLPACKVYTFSNRSQGCFTYSNIDLVPNSNFDSGIRP